MELINLLLNRNKLHQRIPFYIRLSMLYQPWGYVFHQYDNICTEILIIDESLEAVLKVVVSRLYRDI